jgi:hypothetical protein
MRTLREERGFKVGHTLGEEQLTLHDTRQNFQGQELSGEGHTGRISESEKRFADGFQRCAGRA